jgi:uncharacterized protein YmfQ (DUF2313 family)
MLHSDVLKLLMPLDIAGIFSADAAVEGGALDAALASADVLLQEMFPAGSYQLLAEWERVVGVVPGLDDLVQIRQQRVVRKLRELGDIKKPYYVTLAASLGYEIHIQEYLPPMAGWMCAGDEVLPVDDPTVLFVWNIHIANQPVSYFQVGTSAMGERLCDWQDATELLALLEELRPAHVLFLYSV